MNTCMHENMQACMTPHVTCLDSCIHSHACMDIHEWLMNMHNSVICSACLHPCMYTHTNATCAYMLSLCNAYVSVFLDGRPKRKRDAMASCNEGIQAEFSGKGIKQLPNGDWWVPVAWHQWKVTSARPITNVEDATNLQIALVDIRRAFKDRHGSPR